MAALRVLVADQDEIIRQLLTGVLTSQPGWEICGEAANVDEVVEKAQSLDPDLVLLDIGLPYPGGLDAARRVVENNPTRKIIVLGFDDSQAGVREAFQAGALGYVLKAHATRDLLPAVRALEEGRTFFTPRVAETLLRDYVDRNKTKNPADPPLTDREREAIRFLAREAAITLPPPPPPSTLSPRFLKKLAIVAAIAISAGFAWSYYHSKIEEKLPFIDNALERSGLKSPPPALDEINPDTKVWIDLHTGLYYCPGEKAYGKTPRGKYERQREARLDQFQPANRKPCD
jgi:DNA-binding NarL/FixJ family response regulator